MATTGLTATMFANNPATLRFTVTDLDTAGSPPKNLTGKVIKWALTKFGQDGSYKTTPLLVEKKTTNGGELTITDGPNGKCEVYLVPADTVSLAGDFYFELEVFDGSGLNGVVTSTGTLTINKNVVNT